MYFRDSVMARTGSLTLFRWLYHVCLGLGIGHDIPEDVEKTASHIAELDDQGNDDNR